MLPAAMMGAQVGMPIAAKVLTGLGIGSGMLGGKQRNQMQGPTTQTVDMNTQRDPYNPQNISPDAQQYMGGQGGSGNQMLDMLLSSGIGLLGGGMQASKQRQPQWDSIMNGIMSGYQNKYGGRG